MASDAAREQARASEDRHCARDAEILRRMDWMSFIVLCGGGAMLLDREMSSDSCSSERGGEVREPELGRLAIEL